MEEENTENHSTTTAAAASEDYPDDLDSCCSTPYVSAPSSPGRSTPLAGYYYSAPASPTHFVISTANLNSHSSSAAASDVNSSFEFDFSATFPPSGASSPDAMISADELFCNGQIRPMTLSTHLRRPQFLSPLIESDDAVVSEEDNQSRRSRSMRSGSLRRRSRSMSPLRHTSSQSQNEELLARANTSKFEEEEEDKESNETTPCASRSSSSSSGRSSRRWIFLKEFLYRSKSEGRNEGRNSKFWGSLSFSPVKDNTNKKTAASSSSSSSSISSKVKEQSSSGSGVNKDGKKRSVNSNINIGKRRGGLGVGVGVASPSAHELHYTANRAQSEEMKRKTFLPYRQGLLGCLGFSSKSYGAINGFATALNTVSSR